MSDELHPVNSESPLRKRKVARRLFVGTTLLGGVGWLLNNMVWHARKAAERSSDK